MEYQFTTEEFIKNLALIGAAFGFLLGLIPLVLGFMKGKKGMGIIAMIVSVIVGAAAFVFCIVPVAIFSWIIVKKNKPVAAAGDLA